MMSARRRQWLPVEVVAHATWLRLGVGLSYRDIEDLLRRRGVKVSHETVRNWMAEERIGWTPRIWAPQPWTAQCHAVRVQGEPRYLWTARASEGAVLDLLMQSRKDEPLATRRLTEGLAQLERLVALAHIA